MAASKAHPARGRVDDDPAAGDAEHDPRRAPPAPPDTVCLSAAARPPSVSRPPPASPPNPVSQSQQPARRHSVPPRTKFQLPFPDILEQIFAPLDDALIAVGQRRTAGLAYMFSISLTFFTSIEISLVAPPALYALGYDAAAGLCGSVLLVLGIISQVPKKFIFRPRPWMVGRALPIRRDKTSSFPSRAVVCAVVFSWLFGRSLVEEEVMPSLSPFTLWPVIIFVAVLAAFARVNVGAHYPSDTLSGFVLGCLVVKMGMQVESMWRARGCGASEAYPVDPTLVLSSKDDLLRAGWGPSRSLFLVTSIAYAMTLVSIQGFWVKCSYVYGLLLSSCAFRSAFVCSGRANALFEGVAKVTSHGSIWDHVRAVAVFTSLLIMGMVTRGWKGRYRVVTFTVIYFGTLFAILYWRLRQGLADFSGG